MGSDLLSDVMSACKSLEYNHTRAGWSLNRDYDSRIYVSDSIITGSKKQNGRWVVITVDGSTVVVEYHREGYVGRSDRKERFELGEVDADVIMDKIESFSEDRYSVFE